MKREDNISKCLRTLMIMENNRQMKRKKQIKIVKIKSSLRIMNHNIIRLMKKALLKEKYKIIYLKLEKIKIVKVFLI